MPAIPRFTQQELFDIGLAGYLQELRSLARMISNDSLTPLLPLFVSYEEFVSRHVQQQFPPQLLTELINTEDIIHFDPAPAVAEQLLSCANLAAACEAFNGWTIDAGTLTEASAAEVLHRNILISGESEHRLGQVMGVRLNRSDALRVAQLVKLLGLLPSDSSKYDQLALGASMARRDREGFHRIPGIGPVTPGAGLSATSRLNFAVRSAEPGSLVIIDNDSNLTQEFAEINRLQGPRVLALNLDLYDGLDRLATAVQEGATRQRNLVTMFRLEPRALTDITGFVDKLCRVVRAPAYFLATIGSGDTRQEFIDRQQVMEALSVQFQARGQQPLRMMLYDPQNTNHESVRPLFGIAEFASFEILICRLGPEFSAV